MIKTKAGLPGRDTSSGNLQADRRFSYGRDLAARGDFAGAADLYFQALELAPEWPAGWAALGDAFLRLKRQEEAVHAFRRLASLDPSDLFGASLALATLNAGPVPPAASSAYVAGLFDGYASRFDRHLRDGLEYRGPELLRGAVDQIAPHRFARTADLGCGTGLMGEAMRDRTHWLGGCDLSPAMIEAAHGKTVYDHLEVSDLLGFLSDQSFDLILAADVLVYCGDLHSVCAAAAKAMSSGALFAFTVQSGGPEPVAVGTDLRFRHSPDHVRDAASAAGLTVRSLQSVSTRTDAGVPVPGLVAVLART